MRGPGGAVLRMPTLRTWASTTARKRAGAGASGPTRDRVSERELRAINSDTGKVSGNHRSKSPRTQAEQATTSRRLQTACAAARLAMQMASRLGRLFYVLYLLSNSPRTIQVTFAMRTAVSFSSKVQARDAPRVASSFAFNSASRCRCALHCTDAIGVSRRAARSGAYEPYILRSLYPKRRLPLTRCLSLSPSLSCSSLPCSSALSSLLSPSLSLCILSLLLGTDPRPHWASVRRLYSIAPIIHAIECCMLL